MTSTISSRPDFCVFERALYPADMRGYHVRLAVEIGASSLRYDLGRKVGIYAAYGVPEVWVIEANTLITHVHRALGVDGYGTVFQAQPHDTITCGRVPSVSMTLSALGFAPL